MFLSLVFLANKITPLIEKLMNVKSDKQIAINAL